MSKHKSPAKDKEKGGQLVIRVDKSDRAAFIAACEGTDTTAAREIRRFMREFVAAKAPATAVQAETIAADTTNISAEIPAAAEPAPQASAPAQEATADGDAVDVTDKLNKVRRRVKPQ